MPERANELLDIKLGVADDPAKKTGFERGMIGNGERAAVWILWAAQSEVASALPDNFVADALEGANRFLPRNDREPRAH